MKWNYFLRYGFHQDRLKQETSCRCKSRNRPLLNIFLIIESDWWLSFVLWLKFVMWSFIWSSFHSLTASYVVEKEGWKNRNKILSRRIWVLRGQNMQICLSLILTLRAAILYGQRRGSRAQRALAGRYQSVVVTDWSDENTMNLSHCKSNSYCLLLVFRVTPFRVNQNNNQNRWIDTVQNRRKERR